MTIQIDKIIDLSTYQDNPAPKVVQQLSIVHESMDGDITQYYINTSSAAENDKASNALSIPVREQNDSVHYEYVDYDSLVWQAPSARITRRRIDRLGIKAFPNVGAIAHYKLFRQNLSKIVAPVNYKPVKYKAPIIALQVNADNSITITITPPNDVTYMCYRITLQLDLNRLEYVTYDTVITIPQVLVTGSYIIYVTGYVNEGEITSVDSNEIEVALIGQYDYWPAVLPGAEDKHLVGLDFDEQGFALGNMSDGQTIISMHPAPSGGGGGGGTTMWRIKYYSHDGTEYLGREYVEDGDNGEWKPSYSSYAFATTPNGEPVEDAQDNIHNNTNLYVIKLDSFSILKEDMADTTFCRLSMAIGDGATFSGRYFTRTSDEPVIFVTMHSSTNYRSYGVLSLSNTPPTFTNNSYGQLISAGTNLINNNTVYLYRMSGMWSSGTPTYTVDNKSVILENDVLLSSNNAWSFEKYEEELTEFIMRYITLSQTN